MRASLLIVACSLSACVVLAAPAPFFKRDKTILGTTWDEKTDPDRDCEFAPDNSRLFIQIPAKYHDLWPRRKQMNSPRLLKVVWDDFDVRVRVKVYTDLSEKSTTTDRPAFVSAGLLVACTKAYLIKHEFNYGRGYRGYSITTYSFDEFGGSTSTFVHERSPQWKTFGKLRIVWLRLERRGGQFRSLASPDGKEWPFSWTFDGRKWPDHVKVGVTASSASCEPFRPRFDNWELTPLQEMEKK
jgi:regulation of enolase protein 1 (concanavalin A-like superfamily)